MLLLLPLFELEFFPLGGGCDDFLPLSKKEAEEDELLFELWSLEVRLAMLWRFFASVETFWKSSPNKNSVPQFFGFSRLASSEPGFGPHIE